MKEAEAEHIPVTTVTETLTPANANFEQLQGRPVAAPGEGPAPGDRQVARPLACGVPSAKPPGHRTGWQLRVVRERDPGQRREELRIGTADKHRSGGLDLKEGAGRGLAEDADPERVLRADPERQDGELPDAA